MRKPADRAPDPGARDEIDLRRTDTSLPAWSTNPEFTESLRMLVEDELYTLTDVGRMLGISRERVRQLCARRGITRPREARGRLVRVWDDSTNRFRPLPREALARACREVEAHMLLARAREKREAKRASIVAALRALKAKLGRDPTVKEMYRSLGGKPDREHNAMR